MHVSSVTSWSLLYGLSFCSDLLQGRLRDILKLIWFTPYTRGGRHLASSGFEHVFVGEVKNRKVSGFHNWLSFLKEEGEGDLDYKGYIKKLSLGNKVSKSSDTGQCLVFIVIRFHLYIGQPHMLGDNSSSCGSFDFFSFQHLVFVSPPSGCYSVNILLVQSSVI